MISVINNLQMLENRLLKAGLPLNLPEKFQLMSMHAKMQVIINEYDLLVQRYEEAAR